VTAPRASISALFLGRVSAAASLAPLTDSRETTSPAILLTSAVAAFGLWGYISNRLLFAWLAGWSWRPGAIVLKRAYRLRGPDPKPRRAGKVILPRERVGRHSVGLTVMLLYPEHGQFHGNPPPFLIGSVAMGLPRRSPPAPSPSPV